MEHKVINDVNLIIKNGSGFINKALVSIRNINNSEYERYKEAVEQLEKLEKELEKIPEYLQVFYNDLQIKVDEKKTFLIELQRNFSIKIYDQYFKLENIIKKFPPEDIYGNKLHIYRKTVINISSEIENTRFKLIYKLVIEEFKTFFDYLLVNKLFPGNDKTKKVWKHQQNVSLIELGLQEISSDKLLEKIRDNHQSFFERDNYLIMVKTLVKKVKSHYTIQNVHLNEGHVTVKAEVILEHFERNDIKELNHTEKDVFEFTIKGYLTEKEHHEKYLLELIDKFNDYYETTKTNEHLLFYDYEKVVTPKEIGIEFPSNLPNDVLTEMKVMHIDSMEGKLIVILKLTLDGKLAEQTKIIEISCFKKITQIWNDILISLQHFDNYKTPFDLEGKIAYDSLWSDVIDQIDGYLINRNFGKEIINKITWKVKRKGLDEPLNSCNDFVEKELKAEVTGFLLNEHTSCTLKFNFINIVTKKWNKISVELKFNKTVDNFYVGPTDSEQTKEVRKTLIENFSEKFNSWKDFIKIYKIGQINALSGYLKWQGSNVKYFTDKNKFSLTEGVIGDRQNLTKNIYDDYTYKHCFTFDFTLHINDQDTLEAVFIYWGKNENQVYGISAYFENGTIEFLTS